MRAVMDHCLLAAVALAVTPSGYVRTSPCNSNESSNTLNGESAVMGRNLLAAVARLQHPLQIMSVQGESLEQQW